MQSAGKLLITHDFTFALVEVKLSSLLKMVPGGAALLDAEIEKETVNHTTYSLLITPSDWLIAPCSSFFVQSKAAVGLFPSALEEKQQLTLPEVGYSSERVLSELAAWKKYDADGRGRAFAYVYDNDDQAIQQTVTRAANMYIHSNALSPLAFPSLRKLEVECVRMTLNLLHGDAKESCGTLTSGGTESLMCAIKTYRDRARDLWPWITEPECVLLSTSHPATIKACHLFDVKCVFVPVDQKTQTATAAEIAKYITPNTIVIVVSAPQYPHGVMDPVADVAALALANKPHALPVHVDACVGGFLLPFVEELGYPVPGWDFRVKGVTSISVDLHKFGFTHKGASVLGFVNHASYRKYQFFAYTEWPGGLFVSPSLLGTRSGSAISAAWSTLVSLGKTGYMRLAKQTMEAAKKFQSGINKIKGLEVIGQPVMSVTSFHSVDPNLNIHIVADTMEKVCAAGGGGGGGDGSVDDHSRFVCVCVVLCFGGGVVVVM